MKQIYLWFQDNPNISVQTNNTALTKLLSNSKNVGDAVNHCVQWLKKIFLIGKTLLMAII